MLRAAESDTGEAAVGLSTLRGREKKKGGAGGLECQKCHKRILEPLGNGWEGEGGCLWLSLKMASFRLPG